MIAVVLFYSETALTAQEIVVWPPVIQDDFGPRCEGEVLELGFYHGIDCFKRKIGVCSSPFADEYEDRSSDIQVSGPGSPELYRQRYYFAGVDSVIINVMMVRVKLTKTGEIRVTSRSLTEFVVGNTCAPDEYRNYILERTWIYKITVVPKPPTPSLTAERYVAPKSEGIKFKATGCPTADQDYNYAYQWNNTKCLSEANDFYYPDNIPIGTNTGDGSTYYRVRCTALNGTCVSEPSDFKYGLTYNPLDKSKIPGDENKEIIESIENIKNNDDSNYHKYSVEKTICQQYAGNQAVCNVDVVFRLMLESKQYIAPISSDMDYAGFGNNKRYGGDISSVVPYGITYLPSGIALSPVVAFIPDDVLDGLRSRNRNSILTYVDYPNYSVTNYTLPDHILRSGKVMRRVVQECDRIKIITIGEGSSFFGDNPLGAKAARINESDGQRLFNRIDDRLFWEYDRRYR